MDFVLAPPVCYAHQGIKAERTPLTAYFRHIGFISRQLKFIEFAVIIHTGDLLHFYIYAAP